VAASAVMGGFISSVCSYEPWNIFGGNGPTKNFSGKATENSVDPDHRIFLWIFHGTGKFPQSFHLLRLDPSGEGRTIVWRGSDEVRVGTWLQLMVAPPRLYIGDCPSISEVRSEGRRWVGGSEVQK